MNWGWKIVVAFVLFFMLMGTLVYRSATEDHQLVTENYYEKEMAYQEVIDQQATAHEKGIHFEERATSICLVMPENIQDISGELKLYRASNAQLDRSFSWHKENPCLQASGFEKGKWKVSFQGVADDEPFYVEQIWIIG